MTDRRSPELWTNEGQARQRASAGSPGTRRPMSSHDTVAGGATATARVHGQIVLTFTDWVLIDEVEFGFWWSRNCRKVHVSCIRVGLWYDLRCWWTEELYIHVPLENWRLNRTSVYSLPGPVGWVGTSIRSTTHVRGYVRCMVGSGGTTSEQCETCVSCRDWQAGTL